MLITVPIRLRLISSLVGSFRLLTVILNCRLEGLYVAILEVRRGSLVVILVLARVSLLLMFVDHSIPQLRAGTSSQHRHVAQIAEVTGKG